MMKKLFIFIGLGLVLSLGLVSIVLAQQTGAIATPLKSSDLNPTSVSGVGVATENTPTSIDASTNIKSVISYGVATINSKINILNALKTRVDASLLTDNQKGELDHAIADNINRLQALSGNLQAETDINAAKAEVKSIFVDLRISGIFKPKVNLLINLYLQENYLSKVYNQLNPTLQANISSDAATRCGNSDARQSALNQAKVIADSAYTKIVKTRDIVSGLAPEDYTNGSYRVDIATSSLAIRGIQTQLSTIRKQLLAANTYRYTYCSCDLDRNRACGANDFTIFGKDWGRTNCAMPGTKNTACTCDLNHDGRCDMIDWLIFGRDWNKGIICNNNGSCEANETPVNCPADCKITRACQGDLNKDGTVNASDWSIFQQKWGHTDCQAITGGCPCDLNVDGKCDMSDWQLFGRDWGRTDCANNSCSNQCLSGKIGSDAVNSSTGWVCKFNTTTGCWEKSTVTCTSGKIFGSNGGCIVPTCTNFTYSSWSTCSTNGVQTRTITAKTPAGCTGGKPELLSQKCTPGAQTNECSSGQTGCSTSTVAWTCSLSSTGKWMKNEEPCENSPKCYQG
ncbi:MAG: dockerin type I domain-containing protein, partial [Candidatus Falkowbacteria bacterium]|nr:dockerin type I domain-containing protein [Candidatus Falkowbacteria bacterium]